LDTGLPRSGNAIFKWRLDALKVGEIGWGVDAMGHVGLVVEERVKVEVWDEMVTRWLWVEKVKVQVEAV
jgi:hypothetical protein